MVTTAVFPVAGFGTRFLPATKAQPKELLPIIDKPLIQYAVEEAIEAGINRLIFVTGRNKRAIEDHFDKNVELETALSASKKFDLLSKVENILPPDVEIIYIRQRQQLGLGHAISCAQTAVDREPFAVILADDFIRSGSTNNTKLLIDNFEESKKSQLCVMKVGQEEVSKYGIICPGKTEYEVDGLVEKPKLSEAPSFHASIGRYVLNYEIFDILRVIKPGANGELQLADAINVLAKQGSVAATQLRGKRFDCGSVEGFVRANYVEALERGLLNL